MKARPCAYEPQCSPKHRRRRTQSDRSRNAVTYPRDMREKARELQQPLVALAFDRRHMKEGSAGMIEYTALGDNELVEQISALIVEHCRKTR